MFSAKANWEFDIILAHVQDYIIHMGGVMMLGKGATYGALTQQKLNTKRSTKSELVKANDVMPIGAVDSVFPLCTRIQS